ncbi:peptide/opine/nickel ABC uptake transporter, substrate-binding protein [Candidatus Nitrososphaera gargensis Ga9.2]|uniref:Peptide/opine/nickel ABC uptake transporter, substrate-binding protein n=1 Tax=Nitrososphaera gargensis (strain Ga9.2) TaxID=1237085 RepID=K0ILR0_NITGG|nr:peptide/opine/nickel ABC uptake transporter, substrate-binding protein [Candidatus Nitrososphaera gargensis Ga9.2]
MSTFTGFVNPAFSQSSDEKGPYVDQVTFIWRDDENLALEEVRAGDFDLYFFRIPLEAADDAKNDPRLNVYDRTAGSQGLFVNPAPSRDGSTLNPFQFREARYALNYLIDREFVVNEILKGYGSPLVDPFGVYSPEYLNVIDIVESFGFRYNPALAESMISKVMISAGAVKEDNKWMYNGNPVAVKILIRQDDAPRKSMGELISSELEKIGFTVQKEYGDLNKANSVVYGSDPQDLQWHIYTEGFAGTAVFVRYNPIIPAQMYGPWLSRMPGALNPAYWNYKNATLDEVTQRIALFNFTSEEERNELVREAVKMGIQESVRIFVAQKTDPFVASSKIDGLVNDFGAGITSKYSLLNARPTDGSNSLDIGVKQIHQGSWNTIAGLQDTYSKDIYYSVVDLDTFRDPYTGEIIPFRTEWTDISTEGPLGTLDVPADAQMWDPTSQQWKPRGEGVKAISKVTFRPLYSNWHHGIPMDISDMMYADYFSTEWGTDLGAGDLTVDPEYTPQVSESLKLAKGTRYVAPDKIEVYVDIWHYDEKEIADSGTFFPVEPWEIMAASERLVTAGKLTYSRSEEAVRGVGWYDPIVPAHTEMIKQELQKMKSENFVPPALRDVVTVKDAIRRYDASIKWIEDHDNAVIGNGAFYLDSVNLAGGTMTIKAFRDQSYPFEVGHWSKYEAPRLADISRIDVPQSIAIGQPTTMAVDVEVAGQPSSDATVSYFVSDKDGNVVARGEAAPGVAGRFKIELTAEETSKLSPGPNQLRIFASSTEALRPDITTNTILATISATNNDNNPATNGQTSNNNNNPTLPPQQPSGCLIATAAFGSELTPQVQYLRNFRDHYILSTVSGSAFMNTFNSIYYSFSPQVADYEREQPWLQATVKAGLYPLFGILTAAERAHFVANGGEAGALASGAVASALIGAVYLWPAAVSTQLQRRFGTVTKISLVVLSLAVAFTVAGIIIAGSVQLLMASTALFVISLASISAMAAGRLVRVAYSKLSTGRY